MHDEIRHSAPPLCPSSQPGQGARLIFGVVGGSVDDPQVAYLRETLPATPEFLAMAGEAKPTEVFRLAGTCASAACRHFDGARCQLATRVVQVLPTVVDVLPACRLRPDCRWWQQEGKAACLRCPGIITETYRESDLLHQVAGY